MAEHISYTTPPRVTRPTSIHGHYIGEGGQIFKLASIVAFLSLITLGIYRFWGKTRTRRYIWSSTTVQGDAFQYTGTGLEKLLGFLVAVIILAFSLGALQIGLFFFNLSFFSPTEGENAFELQFAAAQASLIILAPLFFFARYRSLRYKLARTRWRGIRFGMENEAWGYAWRAMLLTLLSIVTLGLMLPYQTYKMTKYRTDRTWFGDAQMELLGRWRSLYGAMKHLFIGVGMVVGGLVLVIAAAANGNIAGPIIGGILIAIGYFWAIIGGIHFRVDSFCRLTAMTLLDGKIGFQAKIRTGDVVWRIFAGGIIVGGVYSLAFGMAFAIVAGSIDFTGAEPDMPAALIVAAIAVLLVGLTLMSAFSMALIVQPILRLVINGMTVTNAEALEDIHQRAEDTQVDADGLADALDFGGAI